MPKISKTTRMSLQLTVGKGALPGKGFRKHLQGRVEAPMLMDKRGSFGLGYKPNVKQKKRELEKKQERRKARLNGDEVKWEPMAFPHISRTFVLGGTIHPEWKMLRKETTEEMLGNLNINAMSKEGIGGENLSGMCPYAPGSVLNNWTVEEIPVVFRANSESPDINDMSDAATDSESPFEQDMCMEDSQDFEDDRNCNLSPDLLRMVEQDEKQIQPYKELVEIVSLGEEKEVKIGACIAAETKRDLIELLQEFKDVFAWLYQDIPGLSIDIMVH
ncbi:L-type lectin-domain containing receptor kinase IX.1-like [Gossypium australe]|uniref:L-type lectin-domain containing receptor kinase IX.1-like n=1 Tax=Gossypium australe TaxID=47621 RepID=A0A5B6WV45_9ROSI|nr:L-type lectin-domain containing receptor kinase IX.1-like [Gossypium australe]